MAHVNDDLPYKCRVCSKNFWTLNALKYHMKSHSGIQPFECQNCNKGYLQLVKSYLMTHMSTQKRLVYNIYICQTCGYKVSKPCCPDIVRQDHIKHQLFECDICKATFYNYNDMKTHVIAHRCDDRPFKCRICLEDFRRLKELKDHMQIHPGTKPFECQICKKGYIMQSSFAAHELSHKKSFACEYCAKLFSSKKLLNTHKQYHFKKKSVSSNFCKKSFSYEHTLTIHEIAQCQSSKWNESDMYPLEKITWENDFERVINEIHDPLDISNFSYDFDRVKNEIQDPLDLSNFNPEIQCEDVKLELKEEVN